MYNKNSFRIFRNYIFEIFHQNNSRYSFPGKREEKTRLINNETEPLDSETGQRSIFIEYIFVSNFSKLHI